MKRTAQLLGLGLVALALWGCGGKPQSQSGTQAEAQEVHPETETTPTVQAPVGGRPFITKWQGEAGQELKIPILGTYTLTWYNEATPDDKHTQQVTVSVKTIKEDEYAVAYEGVVPYTFATPTDGIYVVEAGPEGVEGMCMTFENSFEFGPTLLSVVQFGDVVWKRLHNAFNRCVNMRFDEGIDTPNLGQCTNLSSMFDNCKNFNSPLAHWDVSNVTDMNNMFFGCKVFNQPLESWNVSKVTDMSNMFAVCELFNQPLGGWDVRNVTNMLGMFQSCERFNQPLEKWNVSHVTDMSLMFALCDAFNQPLEKWNVSKVKNMGAMFWRAIAFNQPLEKWDVSSVQDMGRMFEETSVFNQPLEKWNVSKVMNLKRMFFASASFDQPLEKWDVGNVIDMNEMFAQSKAFNRPLGGWNISKVQDMGGMFRDCSSFNQSLEAWDLSKVIVLAKILDNCPAADLPFMKEWKEKYSFDEEFIARGQYGQLLGAYDAYLQSLQEGENE